MNLETIYHAAHKNNLDFRKARPSSFENRNEEILTKEFIHALGMDFILLFETHYNPAVLTCIHDELLPLIKQHPASWAILRETSNIDPKQPVEKIIEKELIKCPAGAYLRAIAFQYDVPIWDPVAGFDFQDIKNRKKVFKSSGVSPLAFDTFCFEIFLRRYEDLENRLQNDTKFAEEAAVKFGKPVDYLLQLARREVSNEEFETGVETIGRAWNECIKKQVKTYVLKQKKPNVLVSVGLGHAEAFFLDSKK